MRRPLLQFSSGDSGSACVAVREAGDHTVLILRKVQHANGSASLGDPLLRSVMIRQIGIIVSIDPGVEIRHRRVRGQYPRQSPREGRARARYPRRLKGPARCEEPPLRRLFAQCLRRDPRNGIPG